MKLKMDSMQNIERNFNLAHYPAFRFLVLLLFFILIFTYLEVNIYYIIIFIFITLLSFFLKINKAIIYTLLIIASALLIQYRVQSYRLNPYQFITQPVPAVFNGIVEKVYSDKDTVILLKANGKLRSSKISKLNNISLFLIINNKKRENDKKNNESSKFNKYKFHCGDKIFANLYVRAPNKAIFPNEFDEFKVSYQNHIQLASNIKFENLNIVSYSNSISKKLDKIGNSIEKRLDCLFDPNDAPVLKAMLLGNKNYIKKETKKSFIHTGTAHILSVSGLHIGLISSIILLTLSGIDNRKLKFIIFTVLIITYSAITGFSPSVIRAGLMAISLYFVYAIDRHSSPLNILSFALLLMIFFNPKIIHSPAFQMSASSVLGIIILYPIIYNNFQKILSFPKSLIIQFIIKSFSVSLSSSILVSPIVVYYFNELSLLSIFVNLLIIPLFSFIMFFAIISLFLSVLYFPLGEFYANSVNLLFNIAIKINDQAIKIQNFIKMENELFIFSILISILLLYLIFSNTRNKLLFRAIISISSFIILFNLINFLNPNENINFYKLKRLNVAEVNFKNNTAFFYIRDNNFNEKKIYSEHRLSNYLKSIEKNLFILSNGDISRKTVQETKFKKKIENLNISNKQIKTIENLLKSKTEYSKMQ